MIDISIIVIMVRYKLQKLVMVVCKFEVDIVVNNKLVFIVELQII